MARPKMSAALTLLIFAISLWGAESQTCTCQNGGLCVVATDGTNLCNCAGTGYSGNLCQTPSGLPTSNGSPNSSITSCPVSCVNGDCSQQFNSESYYCKCRTGYTGEACNVRSASPSTAPSTTSTNQTCPVSCQNGRCLQQFNSDQYYCSCNTGYTGSACNFTNSPPPTASTNQSCPVACFNGSCMQQFASEQYYCQCNVGYGGSACNQTTAKAPAPSSTCPVSCVNGRCLQQFNSEQYYCACNTGFLGSACNMTSSPPPATTNQSCPVPCVNGQCSPQFNSEGYYCTCNSGWSGSKCDAKSAPSISPAQTNQSCPVPCDNGKCSQQYNSDQYYCLCNSGYSGARCNTKAPSLAQTTSSSSNTSNTGSATGCSPVCANGRCVQNAVTNSAPYCACNSGYHGTACDQLTASGSTANNKSPSPQGHGLPGGAIFGIVVGAMVAAILLGLGAFFLWRRRQSQTFVKFVDGGDFQNGNIEIGTQKSMESAHSLGTLQSVRSDAGLMAHR